MSDPLDAPVGPEEKELPRSESRPRTRTEEEPRGEAEEAARRLDGRLEAVLFSSDLPLAAPRLATLLGVARGAILEAVDRLNVFYGETSRAFRIVPLAGGFQLVTTPEHKDLLGRLHKERVPTRLSRAALETLSIIAFKQPVTRSEVDAIRGVSASDGVLRHLIERKLVRISGRAEAPGRPLLYGTTREFLGYFGLSAVSDLPRTDELEALLAGDIPGSGSGDVDELEAAPGGEGAGEEHTSRGEDAESGEDAVREGVETEADDADEESLAAELLEESRSTDRESHSGEESDDHEGIRSPQ